MDGWLIVVTSYQYQILIHIWTNMAIIPQVRKYSPIHNRKSYKGSRYKLRWHKKLCRLPSLTLSTETKLPNSTIIVGKLDSCLLKLWRRRSSSLRCYCHRYHYGKTQVSITPGWMVLCTVLWRGKTRPQSSRPCNFLVLFQYENMWHKCIQQVMSVWCL